MCDQMRLVQIALQHADIAGSCAAFVEVHGAVTCDVAKLESMIATVSGVEDRSVRATTVEPASLQFLGNQPKAAMIRVLHISGVQ